MVPMTFCLPSLLSLLHVGYGARCPTFRNQMTLPANVPKYRMPPDTDRFLAGARSTVRVKHDDRAMKRQAEQMVRLTSGEIGSHYLNKRADYVRLNSKPLEFFEGSKGCSGIKTKSDNPASRGNGDMIKSARSDGWNSTRSDFTDRSFNPSASSAYLEGLSQSQNKYMYTLQNLDSGFGRNARRDLITASLPQRPTQELVWAATTIQHSALQSKQWSSKLRRDNNQ
jgi:hypothetical protein